MRSPNPTLIDLSLPKLVIGLNSCVLEPLAQQHLFWFDSRICHPASCLASLLSASSRGKRAKGLWQHTRDDSALSIPHGSPLGLLDLAMACLPLCLRFNLCAHTRIACQQPACLLN
jgi:hypothetical protein